MSQKNERKLTGLMVAMCKIRAKWPKMLQSAPILLICSDGQLKVWTGTNYCKASTCVCVEGKLSSIAIGAVTACPTCMGGEGPDTLAGPRVSYPHRAVLAGGGCGVVCGEGWFGVARAGEGWSYVARAGVV